MRPSFALSAFALTLSLRALAAPQELKQPSADEVARIESALPAQATAAPKRPRKVLIVNQCEGFVHTAVPYAAKAFELLGRKTGAFTATVVDDLSILERPEFDTFDAVVMNNTTLRLPLLADADEAREARAQQRFVDFVRGGKGLIGVHAATDCLYTWPAYGEMIGGYFDGHPWNEEVRVKLDDPGHPLLAAFKGVDFTVADEIYQFRSYSRDALRVLMSLDVRKTDMTKDKIKRKDGDFGVAWIREYGKGRVFYFSLGHRHEIFWNAPVLKCYLDGIQYALGDLPADARPSAQLTKQDYERSREAAFGPGMESMLAELAAYKLGVSDSLARQVDAFVDEHLRDTSANRDTLSKGLARVAADPQATPDGRALACRKLSLAGTDNAVPALAKLLDDPALGAWARYALARMPGPAVDAALVEALARTKGQARLAVAALTGERRVSAAVPALSALAVEGGADATAVAAEALGQIGGKEAAQSLTKFQGSAKGAARAAVDRALLACAERARLADRDAEAAPLYALLSGPDTAGHVRAAAFYGSTLPAGAKGAEAAVRALKGADAELARAGARLVRDMPGKDVVAAAANALTELPEANRIIAVAALARRGDGEAQEGVLKLLASESAATRLAALQAVESLGDKRAVAAVMKVALTPDMDKASCKAAAKALSLMSGQGVDQAILVEMRAADVKAKAAYAGVLGARKARAALPELLAAARSPDGALAGEARGALSLIARPDDMPELVALTLDTADAAGLRELERILVKVAKAAGDEKLKTSAVLKALKKELPASARGALLTALGKMEAPSSLPVLLAAAKDGDPAVRRAVFKTIAENWPDAAPLQALRDASRSDADEECRVLALSGYARMLTLPSALPVKEKLKLYREALDLAKGTKEKRVLIEGLGALIHKDALTFVAPYMKDSSVSKDAFQAALSISKGLNGGAMALTGSIHGEERFAVDNNPKTRWTTGASKKGGEWFVIDLGYEDEIRSIYLDAGGGGDQPRGCEIYVSLDGKTWGAPVLKGDNARKPTITIDVPPTYGRYIKIVQTGADGSFWSINELRVNGVPDRKEYAPLDRASWKASAFNASKGQDPKSAIDGDLTTRWGTGGAMKPGDWLAVDLGGVRTVHAVVMNAAKSGGDYPREYEIYTSLDGAAWYGPVGTGKGEGALVTAPVLPAQARHVKIVQTGSTEFNWWSVYDLQMLGE